MVCCKMRWGTSVQALVAVLIAAMGGCDSNTAATSSDGPQVAGDGGVSKDTSHDLTPDITTCEPGTWRAQEVDPIGAPPGYDPLVGPVLAGPTSTAVDPQGGVHIAYSDFLTGEIKHAYRSPADGGWVVEVVDTSTTGDKGTKSVAVDVALGKGGSVHLAYPQVASFTEVTVRHAMKPPEGEWAIEDVTPVEGGFGAFLIDPGGRMHLLVSNVDSTGDSSHSVLDYIARPASGSSWTTAERATDDYEGHTALATDSEGTVHVAYRTANGGLGYTRRTPSGIWSTETVAEGSYYWISVAVEPDDTVHLTYSDYTTYTSTGATFGHAWRGPLTETWTAEVAADSTVFYVASLIAPSGQLEVVASSGGLYHLQRSASGSWAKDAVDADTGSGWYTSLAQGPAGDLHASAFNEGEGALIHYDLCP